jgi:hypothetical protein
VNERPPGTAWLFDLAVDPTEQTNLAAREPQRVAALRARVSTSLHAPSGRVLWPSLVEMPVNVDKTLAEPDAADDVAWQPVSSGQRNSHRYAAGAATRTSKPLLAAISKAVPAG